MEEGHLLFAIEVGEEVAGEKKNTSWNIWNKNSLTKQNE